MKAAKRLWVIAGHGAEDPGACANGYREAKVVRRLAKAMKKAAVYRSQVKLCDMSRDWYADGGVSQLDVPEGEAVVELHTDSAAAEARGGHVCIGGGLSPDAWDRALAAFIAKEFPGRAKSIVKRADLANLNRAKARGINYRLLETCFISNKADIAKLEGERYRIAAGIVDSFGVKARGIMYACDSYKVKVTRRTLAVRKDAGIVNKKLRSVKKGKVLTIVAHKWTKAGYRWGLVEGGGWVMLKHTRTL